MWLDESEMRPGDVELILHHVTRAEWRALPARGRLRPRHPYKLVLDHYTDTETCHTYRQCSDLVRDMQKRHMAEGFTDIKYNFLIGGDGNIYEGRGWGAVSSRALRTFIKLWRRRLDIAFIGDFTDRKIPEIMQLRYDHILEYGVHFNLIRPFCNTLHVSKDLMDMIPLECEVRKTTRKKPPGRLRKKKKKKPKESSDLSFHSNTDLSTNTTDSLDTSDREVLPFTSSFPEEDTSSTESSDSSRGKNRWSDDNKVGVEVVPDHEVEGFVDELIKQQREGTIKSPFTMPNMPHF